MYIYTPLQKQHRVERVHSTANKFTPFLANVSFCKYKAFSYAQSPLKSRHCSSSSWCFFRTINSSIPPMSSNSLLCVQSIPKLLLSYVNLFLAKYFFKSQQKGARKKYIHLYKENSVLVYLYVFPCVFFFSQGKCSLPNSVEVLLNVVSSV